VLRRRRRKLDTKTQGKGINHGCTAETRHSGSPLALVETARLRFAAVGKAQRGHCQRPESGSSKPCKSNLGAVKAPAGADAKAKGKKAPGPQSRASAGAPAAAKEGAESKQAAIEKMFDKSQRVLRFDGRVGRLHDKGRVTSSPITYPAWVLSPAPRSQSGIGRAQSLATCPNPAQGAR